MSEPRPGFITVWTRCNQCRNLEGWDVPDDTTFVVPACELCGSWDISLADYDGPYEEAA